MTSETTPDAETGVVVAVVYIRGQQEPVCIRSIRPLAVIAADALPMADKLLTHSGRGLARRAPAAIASVHAMTSV